MVDVVTIAGSPSSPSRCAAVIDRARQLLDARGLSTALISVRDLDPRALTWGAGSHPAIQPQLELVTNARAVVLATPVYKAAYSGLVKMFLDLLPNSALADKVILPVATAGSLAHLLILDYALKPVLASLGARHILAGVCVLDADFVREGDRFTGLVETTDSRLAKSIDELQAALPPLATAAHRQEVAV